MEPKTIKGLKNGMFLEVKESGEAEPIGIIIDLFDKDEELLDTWTIHYDDYEEEQ